LKKLLADQMLKAKALEIALKKCLRSCEKSRSKAGKGDAGGER
jgi:hypothetical protein